MERKLSWENPTSYTDGTPLPPEKVSGIKIHVFKNGAETYVTLPGVTEWPIDVGAPGTQSAWELSAELDGMTSEKTAPLAYTEPFQTPVAPTRVAIG